MSSTGETTLPKPTREALRDAYRTIKIVMAQYKVTSREWDNLCETKRLLEVEANCQYPGEDLPEGWGE